jgi:dihydrofolate reductase
VLTRNKDFQAPGCIVCSSLGEAIEAARAAGETECFVIGGAAVYREAMPLVEKLYLTRVLSHVEGDVFFPEWNDKFQKESEESFPADEKNDFPTTFEIWVRKK